MNLYINYFLHAVKNTFNYKGRARRKEYWSIVFIYVILYLMLMLAGDSYTLLLLIGGLILITIPIAISVTVRRLHDINWSGWWILGAMIPIFGIIIGFIDSYPKANKWGENPKKENISITENDRKKAMKFTGGIFGVILLVFIVSFLSSLLTSYKCDSSDAKEMILKDFKERISNSYWIESEFYNEHINEEDIRQYSYANGLDYHNVLAQEKEKLASKLANYKEKIVESIKLENILTHKIDKDVKKCNCEATIIYGKKEQNIQYSVQENSEGEINVKLYN